MWRYSCEEPSRRIVIVWSYSFRAPYFPDRVVIQPYLRIKQITKELIDDGIVIAGPAGKGKNKDPGRREVQAPGAWESPELPLIIVGAVDNQGYEAPFSQGLNHVTVSAPGNPIECVSGIEYDFIFKKGTSRSAGMLSA